MATSNSTPIYTSLTDATRSSSCRSISPLAPKPSRERCFRTGRCVRRVAPFIQPCRTGVVEAGRLPFGRYPAESLIGSISDGSLSSTLPTHVLTGHMVMSLAESQSRLKLFRLHGVLAEP